MDIEPRPHEGAGVRRHIVVATPGGMKLASRWQGSAPHDGGRVGRPTGRTGSPVKGFSAKARRQMRWTWNALPWNELERPMMITLTYPADWRTWCPDGMTLKRHLRAFRERWRRRWGQPRGVWVLEFQPRGHRPMRQRFAPHFHLYVELPAEAELWHDPGTRSPVWYWARDAWWEIVKSGDLHHRRRGVHIRPCFYDGYEDDQRDAKRVGDYFWRESGKLGQKAAPKGFEGVKWWDVWGIDPIEIRSEVSQTEFVKMRRVLRRKRDDVAGVKVRIRDQSGRLVPRRRELSLDGITLTNLGDGFAFSEKLLIWAEDEAG
jgi:hypothetical protein